MIHNYRWRLNLSEGERKYDDLEKRLAAAPVITVPTITLEGDANGAPHPDHASYAKKFSGRYLHRTIKGGIGHNCRRKHRRLLRMQSPLLITDSSTQRLSRVRGETLRVTLSEFWNIRR